MRAVRAKVQRERRFPHNLDAERFVLGSVLLDNNAMALINGYLEASDFFHEGHCEIYRAMTAHIDGDSVADLNTVSEYLSVRGLLEKCGGAGYIASLMDLVPTGVEGSLREACRKVKQHSDRRKIIHIFENGLTQALEMIESPESIAEEVSSSVVAIFNHNGDRQLLSVAEIVQGTANIVEGLVAPIIAAGGQFRTGFRDLDQLIRGFRPGEMSVLAARPSLGKTALGLAMAINVARESGLPAAFFSLEMSRESLLVRAVSSEGRINSQKAAAGLLTKEERITAISTLANICCLPLWIDDTSSISISGIRGRARQLKRKHGLGLIVVDYLQLMGSTQRYEKRVDLVTHLSQGLKAISKDLNVPVLALSQLSRAPEGKIRRRPQLSDLRDSGSIEQDADLVMFLWKENSRAENAMTGEYPTTLIVGKQRNGPTGDVPLTFLKAFTKFVDCDLTREED